MVSLGAITVMLAPNAIYANDNDKIRSIKNETINVLDESNISVNRIDQNIDTNSSKEISVIIEFNSPALAQAKHLNKSKSILKSNIEKEHKEFKEHLNKLKKEKSIGDFKTGYEYETVFNGISMTLKGTEVEKLLESKVVKHIWNNDIYKLEIPKEDKVKGEISPRMNDSLPHLGVDKLHKDGLKGEGVKVGVLDTGVDYNHPDLKDNYKGGYDFIDNDPMETTYKDWQESDNPEFISGKSYYTSHGTHVSGTIAANAKSNSESGVLGVAPEADLYVYRVLGPYGSGATDGIVAAIIAVSGVAMTVEKFNDNDLNHVKSNFQTVENVLKENEAKLLRKYNDLYNSSKLKIYKLNEEKTKLLSEIESVKNDNIDINNNDKTSIDDKVEIDNTNTNTNTSNEGSINVDEAPNIEVENNNSTIHKDITNEQSEEDKTEATEKEQEDI